MYDTEYDIENESTSHEASIFRWCIMTVVNYKNSIFVISYLDMISLLSDFMWKWKAWIWVTLSSWCFKSTVLWSPEIVQNLGEQLRAAVVMLISLFTGGFLNRVIKLLLLGSEDNLTSLNLITLQPIVIITFLCS